MEHKRQMDGGVVFALSWLGVALLATALFGPKLGLRGWIWLGLHDIVCLVGCTHELWRGWHRRRKAQGTQGRSTEMSS